MRFNDPYQRTQPTVPRTRRKPEAEGQGNLLDYREGLVGGRHPVTSFEAADKDRTVQRMKVLRYIAAQGEYGATDIEVQHALGLDGSSQRPRRIELHEDKLIQLNGLTRKTAKGARARVWVATEAGRRRVGAE